MAAGTSAFAAASAGDETSGSVDRGRKLYRVYCANCHGETGRGDGAMREVLKVPPADLTTLRRRSGGTFAAAAIERKVDGREAIRGHGSREMPVWGPTFQAELQARPQAEEVAQRIRDLVFYLETIQDP